MAEPQEDQPEFYQNYLNLGTHLEQSNYENEIAEIREQARESFADFDGNFNQINPVIFAYIDRFARLDNDIDSIRTEISQSLIPVNQMRSSYRAVPGRIIDRFRRIMRLRNNLREYLLSGGFADQRHLDGDPQQGIKPGFTSAQGSWRVPPRFRYMMPEAGLGNFLIAAGMVNEYLIRVRDWLEQSPPPDRFVAIGLAANEAANQFGQMLMIDQLQTGPAFFDYINQWRMANETFERFEFLIEAGVELLQRIVDQLPNLMSKSEKDQVLEFGEWLTVTRTQRGMIWMALVQNGLATEIQLTFGYSVGDERPPAFQVQWQGGGQGQ